MGNEKTRRMRYSQYKSHYADCKTVPGTYDKVSRTIEVIIPDGREKPSGVRGERFWTYQLWATDGTRIFPLRYRAVCQGNAEKQHQKWCKEMGWTPCAEEGA